VNILESLNRELHREVGRLRRRNLRTDTIIVAFSGEGRADALSDPGAPQAFSLHIDDYRVFGFPYMVVPGQQERFVLRFVS